MTLSPARVRLLFGALVAGALLLGGGPRAAAQQSPETEEAFAELSLRYRTALHYDSMLENPLEGLVRLYTEADRVDELIGLYRSHVEQYPDDAGAKTVLIRVLRKLDRPGVGELIAAAVPRHPEYAPFHYLLFRFLREKGDARALESLSTAIDLEANQARRREWLEELLQVSESGAVRSVAVNQLEKRLADPNLDSAGRVALADLMQRYEFWELALQSLAGVSAGMLDAAATVEAGLLEAKSRAEIGETRRAGAVLEGVLAKLAPDHWRRREIMNLRYSVIASDEEREALLERYAKVFRENPRDESALIDYVELLVAADRQSEAAQLLVNHAGVVPDSPAIENRALEILDSINDPQASVRFLSDRLEEDPERADLRFRLVKALYTMRKDADAEQEFRAVVAGGGKEEISERILELQRYLRSIDRIEAAGDYLERYVRENPERLGVARELAEIYVKLDQISEIQRLASRVDPARAPLEEVVDLVEFLTREGYPVPAKTLLTAKIASDGESFELGLRLIDILGSLGESSRATRLISRMRELADTTERYGRWLETAVGAHGKFETLDRFFDTERNRFSFDDGTWPKEKVERFVLLCEIGERRLMADRVTRAVREQLATGSFDAALRVRLRRFLVEVLEDDPTRAEEVIRQLELLLQEDPARRLEYELRRALVHHRNQRVDLAQEALLGMNLAEVEEVSLVQEAVNVLIDYGYLEEAVSALAAVNRLAPSDLFAWEKRLTLLAVLRSEEEFRALVRQIRSGEIGGGLSRESLHALDRHLVASYWRSTSRLFASGDPRRFEEILPLLASVDRESSLPVDATWTEWSRAMVLRVLGRTEASEEAKGRLLGLLADLEREYIRFPDGIRLSLDGADRFLERIPPVHGNGSEAVGDFLFAEPVMRWAYRTGPGQSIETFAAGGERVYVLDQAGSLEAIDAESGKLVWQRRVPSAYSAVTDRRPRLFRDLPGSNRTSDALDIGEHRSRLARTLLVSEDRVAIADRESLRCYRGEDGEVLWVARLPFDLSPRGDGMAGGASPDFSLVRDGPRVHVFEPRAGVVATIDWDSGKLLWESSVVEEESQSLSDGLFSLNTGVDAEDGLVFVYGTRSLVLDGMTGQALWTFAEENPVSFPVQLRRERGSEPVQIEVVADGGDPESMAAAVGIEGDGGRRLIDFLDPRSGDQGIESSLGSGATTLASSAAFWSSNRLRKSSPAHALISGGYLWLMKEGAVRRVSVRFPVASRTLPASGAFLGRRGNHVWFLDGSDLVHLDFAHQRRTRVSLDEIGAEDFRAAFSGNRIIVRGESGVRAINSRTGLAIGTTIYPETLRGYLEEVRERGTTPDRRRRIRWHWQGRSVATEDGAPVYCRSVQDVIRDDAFFTRFGDDVIVCLGPAENSAGGETPSREGDRAAKESRNAASASARPSRR